MATFKYDVAFSFLGADEPTARQLNDLLAGRLRTFIYSDAERQVQLAGADGALKFAQAFREEAASVVILYRDGWGSRGFTAVEADAIRNRAFELGYDFVTMVPLDSPPSAPVWFPKHRLWVGHGRWGWDHVAAVVEQRAIEAGGRLQEQSVGDVAIETQRLIAGEAERSAFLNSTKGVEAAHECFLQFCAELELAAGRSLGQVAFEKESRDLAGVTAGRHTRKAHLSISYTNTLDDSEFRVWSDTFTDRRWVTLAESEVSYQLDLVNGVAGWREKDHRARPMLSPKELADEIVKTLLRKMAADALLRRR